MTTRNILKKLSCNDGNVLQTISREDIRLVYTFTRRLGSGSYGTVRIAHKTAVGLNKEFAVKSIKREQIEDSKTDAELT